MSTGLNQEQVNDAAKLIMHRLVARSLARDPSLLPHARKSLAKMSLHFPDRTFIREWDELLQRPSSELRTLLAKRDRKMARLRVSSPFGAVEGIDFTDPELRRRIWRAARRVVALASGQGRHRDVRPMVNVR